MTIRIIQDHKATTNVLHVVGWLEGEGAAELLRIAEAAGLEVTLDLSELRAADPRGIEALQTLAFRGVALTQVPPLIALMLDSSSE